MAAGQGEDVAVTHPLRGVRSQDRAIAAAAVHDNFSIAVGVKALEIPFENSLSQMVSSGSMLFQPFVVFTYIQQDGLRIARQAFARLFDGDFLYTRACFVDQIEKAGRVVHGEKLVAPQRRSTEFPWNSTEIPLRRFLYRLPSLRNKGLSESCGMAATTALLPEGEKTELTFGSGHDSTAFVKNFLRAAVSVALLALCGCARDRASLSVTPNTAFSPSGETNAPASDANLIVTPEKGLNGKVAWVNSNLRFVVLTFPVGQLPANNQRLDVYRGGLKVGELKVSGPQNDDNVVADIVVGEAEVGDAVRNN